MIRNKPDSTLVQARPDALTAIPALSLAVKNSLTKALLFLLTVPVSHPTAVAAHGRWHFALFGNA